MREKIKSLLKSDLYSDVIIACLLLREHIPWEEGFTIIQNTKLSSNWQGTPDNNYHYFIYGEKVIQIGTASHNSIWISPYPASSTDIPI